MQITTTNGTLLDDGIDSAPLLNRYIGEKKIEDIHTFVATEKDGRRGYVLVEKSSGRVIYHSQNMEAVAVRLDMLAFQDQDDAR